MLKDYLFFINEKNTPTNKAPLLISDKFKMVLNSIDDDISETMIDYVEGNYDDGYEIFTATAIDIEEDGNVTYIPAGKYHQMLKKEDRDYYNKYRQKIIIGRLIVKLFGDKFTQRQIENFSNSFKAIVSVESKYFEVVKGEDIRKYYLVENYLDERGTLGNSCMKHKNTQKYLDMYVNNDKISLVILKKKDHDGIIGRALLWKIDEPDCQFMDRIYTIDQFDINAFINYAKKNGWKYKNRQCFNCNDVEFNGKNENYIEMITKLNIENYEFYPFLDTMFYYSEITGEISNKKDIFKKNTDLEYFLELKYSDGGFEKMYNFYIDKYRNERILSEDAVYCKYEDAHCNKKDAINTTYPGNGFPAFPNNIVNTKDGFTILKEDAIWSEKLNGYIWKLFYDKKNDKILSISDLIGKKIKIKNNARHLMTGNWNEEMEKYIGHIITVNEYMTRYFRFGSIRYGDYSWYINVFEPSDY